MQSAIAPVEGSQGFGRNAIRRSCQPQDTLCACLSLKSSDVRRLSGSLFARDIRRDWGLKRVIVQARKGRTREAPVARARKKTTKTSTPKTTKGSEADTASVTISLQKEAEFGFQYALVGGDPSLGDWDPAKAAILDWSEGHVWSKTLTLPAERSIEYKFILVNNNMEAIDWQPGENRTIATSSNVSTIRGHWEEELAAGESEDASTDGVTSDGDASDEATSNGAATEPKASGWFGRKEKPAEVTANVASKKGGSSAEGSLAEADVAPAATPAIEKAANAAGKVSNNKPADVIPKPSTPPNKVSPPSSAPASETKGGVNGLAVAGASALVAVAIGAATIFTHHESTAMIQKGDVKGAVSHAVNRVNNEGLSGVAGTVGEHGTRIINSVSETSGKHLDALSGHLEGLSRATGESLGGLSKTAGEGLGGLSKSAGESLGGLTKAASEGLGGLTKATGDGVGGVTQKVARR